MRHAASLVTGGAWIALLTVWIVMAFTTKPTVERRGFTPSLLLIIVVEGLFFYGRHATQHSWVHRVLWTPSADEAIIGAIVVVIGAAFALWARLTIGGNWSGGVTVKENHELIRRGPYAIVRHPIYTGLFAMLIGGTVEYGNVLYVVTFALSIAIFAPKIRSEEHLMEKTFPSEYSEYRDHVKAVIPFLL
ncbi:MAG: methyltransferase family protein [Acidimicrobiales bacterium]